VALRVGTIHKAFDGVEAKYGGGRIFGRFEKAELNEPRTTAAFLHLTLEYGGTDFAPLFGHALGGLPGFDPSRYFPDPKLAEVTQNLAQAWREAEQAAGPEPAGALGFFVAGDWGSDPTYPNRFAAAVAKLPQAPALRAFALRYSQHASTPPAERPRIGGPRALRQFRGLLRNAAVLKNEGGANSLLRKLTKEYLQKKGLNPALADADFPRFASIDKAKFGAEQYTRFLEARLTQTLSEVTLNTASYALRDLARRGGGQLLAGTEHAFFADRDTTTFLQRSGVGPDVAPKANLTTLPEGELREVHKKAFDLLQTEFIMTAAELSERIALAARERLV
jgi:hypothetical protein